MSYSQAFTDAEIVTIATVAATALGGVVIGLGRGQARNASNHHRLPDPQRLAHDARRQVKKRAPATGDFIDRLGRGALAAVESALDRVPSERPTTDLKMRRPQLNIDVGSRSELAQSLREVATNFAANLNVPGGVEDVAGKARKRASELAARERATKALKSDVNPAEWIALARSKMPSTPEAPRAATSGLEEVQGRIASAGGRLSEVPESVQTARERTRDELQTRVSKPASRAANTAKDVTMESLAAAAWLSLGAAIVYFGLLSSERRERVKAAICGGIDQIRLLALDLQGYEPEM